MLKKHVAPSADAEFKLSNSMKKGTYPDVLMKLLVVDPEEP